MITNNLSERIHVLFSIKSDLIESKNPQGFRLVYMHPFFEDTGRRQVVIKIFL